jgi:uncharacterized membrane protein
MTDHERDAALSHKVAELERRLAAVEAAVRTQPAAPGTASVTATAMVTAPAHRPDPGTPSAGPHAGGTTRSRATDPFGGWLGRERWVELGEGLLGRAGVALIVLGMVFLFRFAVDQGWITPVLRIAAGLFLGTGLLVAGMFRFAGRRRYRQILMGGGVIILFVTGLAASELYALVSGPASLAFQGLVAALALAIALREDAVSMATIGAVGALLPPAFLLADAVSGVTLWAYLFIVIAWAATLYALRGWNTLLVFGAAAAAAATFHRVEAAPVHAAAMIVLVLVWVGFAALPLLRNASVFGPARLRQGGQLDAVLLFPVPLLVTAALAVSASVNLPGDGTFERVAALAAVGFAGVAAWIARAGRMTPAGQGSTASSADVHVPFSAATFAAVVCAAAALIIRADGAWIIVALATSAAAALAVTRLLRVEATLPVAHLLNGWIGLMLLGSVDMLAQAPFDPHALAFAAATATVAASAFALRQPRARLAYLAGVFVAVHVLIATELGGMPGAPWLGSLGYTVAGTALLVTGLRTGSLLLQRAGMASLALLVLRLFAVDLASAGVGVRIALFLGCGFTFLALSYMFRMRRPAA